MTSDQRTEILRVLDDLSALSISLKCYSDHPPDMLILPAGKVAEACGIINDAVAAARKCLD